MALVACRARSVALLRSLSEADSRPASSLASILAWKTWKTAIECSLSSRWVGASSECRCGSARLGRMARPRLPSDSCGRAEMCGHRLIQRRQVLVSLFFSAVNGCESSWSRRTDARQVGGASRFRELVMYFGEEGGRALTEGHMVPWKTKLCKSGFWSGLCGLTERSRLRSGLCGLTDRSELRSGLCGLTDRSGLWNSLQEQLPGTPQIPQTSGVPAPSFSTSWRAPQGHYWRGPWGPHHFTPSPRLPHRTSGQTSLRQYPADIGNSRSEIWGCVGRGGCWR